MEIADIKDIQIVYDLAKDLDVYADDLHRHLSSLKKEHGNMANYFKGKQFNELTAVIDDIGAKIGKSISDLKEFAENTKKEAIQLSIIHSISLK